MEHLVGPVVSRRLGASLGIDLFLSQTCTLDCVYCECGPTANLTRARKEYVPLTEVISELRDFLAKEPKLDYITLAGSGEPTLYSKLGELVEFIKEEFSQYKLALLTNGTLFNNQEIIEEVKPVDLIVPSLDAVSEAVFKKINRPHEELNLEEIIQGLVDLRRAHSGQMWLEVFLLPGVNDTGREIERFRDIIARVAPDKVQLNTLDRLGAKEDLTPVSYSKMKTLAIYLGDKAEIIKRENDKGIKEKLIKAP